MSNAFTDYVDGFAHLRATGVGLNAGLAQRPVLPEVAADAPVCLVFSPHPDDEAIGGALPYRLRQEAGWRVVNVAVTLGSNAARRAARWSELSRCCDFLGFELVSASGENTHGLERISPLARAQDAAHWEQAVAAVAGWLQRFRPRLVVCPHDNDGHPAHVGTHLLVGDALRRMDAAYTTFVAMSEYWNTQASPGLMVELGVAQVADLMAALCQHVGEVSRNPYHLTLPAWFMDGVRRGAERVGLPGSAAPGFDFAALYGWQRWNAGQLSAAPARAWPLKAPPAGLFA